MQESLMPTEGLTTKEQRHEEEGQNVEAAREYARPT